MGRRKNQVKYSQVRSYSQLDLLVISRVKVNFVELKVENLWAWKHIRILKMYNKENQALTFNSVKMRTSV